MTDSNIEHSKSGDTDNRENIVSILITPQLTIILNRLIKWSRVVGGINSFLGVLYLMTIIKLWIPTALLGCLYLMMGIKLLSSANNFYRLKQRHESVYFETALNKLQSFMFMNSFLLLLNMIVIILILLGMFTVNGFFRELFQKSTEEFASMKFLSNRYPDIM